MHVFRSGVGVVGEGGVVSSGILVKNFLLGVEGGTLGGVGVERVNRRGIGRGTIVRFGFN
jgi:hypothetical protein